MAQRQLKCLGFDPGPIDGIYGPKMRAAVGEFEQSEKRVEASRRWLLRSAYVEVAIQGKGLAMERRRSRVEGGYAEI
jgi:peptidoglycan hydrolase-like protein with peptidoglycan-binding domain